MSNRSKFPLGKHRARLLLNCWRLAFNFENLQFINGVSMKTEKVLRIGEKGEKKG